MQDATVFAIQALTDLQKEISFAIILLYGNISNWVFFLHF